MLIHSISGLACDFDRSCGDPMFVTRLRCSDPAGNWAALFILSSRLPCGRQQGQEKRISLVIGEAAYSGSPAATTAPTTPA